MDILTIDFETYYAKDFTLSKMTTEAYIRDDRFEVIGVSVKKNGDPGVWAAGPDVHTLLNSFDYANSAILCHHTAFDGAILAWRYGIRPKFWLDTLSMSRPTLAATIGGSLKMLATYFKVGVKGTEVVDAFGKCLADFTPAELQQYGVYCINDGDLCWGIFNKLRVGFPVSELMVIDQTIRMFTEPVFELDQPILEKHLEHEIIRKQLLLKQFGGGDPEAARKVISSNKQFAALLNRLNVPPPMKISPTTGKTTYAFAKTDQGLLDLLEHHDPNVALVVEVRLGVKSTIEETRTKRFIDISNRGPLPIMLNYYGAHTGRFSGGDKVNLQNLPARKGNVIRTSLRAPDGHKVVVCDSAQIEARLLAYLSGQEDLLVAFREGRDVYSEFASMVFSKPLDEISKEDRFVGKTCILGLGYGMGPEKFQRTLSIQGGVHIHLHEAERIVKLYRHTYTYITRLWRDCDNLLTTMLAGQGGVVANILSYGPEGITLPSKLVLKYTALRYIRDDGLGYLDKQISYISKAREFRKLMTFTVTGKGEDNITWTYLYGGKVVENITQALARIVITEQMTAIGELGYQVVLQVHDEIVTIVPENNALAAQQTMERVMSLPPSWAVGLPVACESAIGDSYGEAK